MHMYDSIVYVYTRFGDIPVVHVSMQNGCVLQYTCIHNFLCSMQNLVKIGQLQKEKKSEEWQSYTDEQKKEVWV